MTDKVTMQNPDMLLLKDREEVETAWRAISIAGNAPTAEPILGLIIELMPSSSAPDLLQGAVFYCKGGNAKVIKQEIAESLQFVANNHSKESSTSKQLVDY